MKINKLLIAAAILACSTSVIADNEKIDYSLSIKSWNNVLSTRNSSSSGITTPSQNAPIIAIVARKGDYFVAANALLRSTYTYSTSYMSRTDYDIAFGYRATENISILGGYKTLIVVDGSQTNWKETNTGFFIGASGFSSIADQSFAYGNIQYVPNMKHKTTANEYYRNQKFTSTEFGLGYIVNKSTQLTGGYRYQIFDSYNITRSRSENAKLDGIIFGLNINL